MDWTAVIIVMLLILVLGSAIAIFWWNLAARVSPYPDEVERQRAQEEARRRGDAGEVVIVRTPGGTGKGERESGGGKNVKRAGQR